MKAIRITWIFLMAIINVINVSGQGTNNCFLNDFTIKKAVTPPYANYSRTTGITSTTVNIDFADTVSKVSKYIFGNALAVWVSPSVNNPLLVGYLKKLKPSLIRFPGGSWSDVYFWNGNPGDLPSSIPNSGGTLVPLGPVFGQNQSPTFDSYLNMRDQIGTQGLVTVNYAYARYGKSTKPAEQAAHYAANWVRHDNGHTKFWEIGNEVSGNWEAGWRIDTAANKDDQPLIINGKLYGQHFKIFADSMRKAAAEVGSQIYIGAIIIQFDAHTDVEPNKSWNAGVFSEVGDTADFYVVHNYFGGSGTPQSYFNSALNSIDGMHNFITQDIANKSAAQLPVALTEWNISDDAGNAKTSIVNGMQGVLTMSEMAKLGYGLSCRWLIANWETDGMFYHGASSTIPAWNPRPDYYYLTYLQKYVGSYFLGSTVTGSTNIKAYTTLFDSSRVGIVLVNMGNTDQTVSINLQNSGYGNRYYYYSFTGGTDDPNFSKYVYVNDSAPETTRWGPLAKLDSLIARSDTLAYPVKIRSPRLSVQYILLDAGNNTFSLVNVAGLSVSTKNSITSINVDNGTLQFTANVTPVNATDNSVFWSSSDTSVAKVDQYGLVKAMYNGTVKIKATSSDGGFKDSLTITVSNQRYEVTNLKLIVSASNTLIKTPGGTLKVTSVITPSYAEDTIVTWSISDTSIAVINNAGLVTAKKNGRDTVTCVTHDGNFKKTLIVYISGQSTGIIPSELSEIKAYPNPARDNLIIENEFPVQYYEILNIDGKVLKTINNPGLKTVIQIDNFKGGIYLIRAHSKADVKIIRFIKI
jgi:uncharacterized protein YjdB